MVWRAGTGQLDIRVNRATHFDKLSHGVCLDFLWTVSGILYIQYSIYCISCLYLLYFIYIMYILSVCITLCMEQRPKLKEGLSSVIEENWLAVWQWFYSDYFLIHPDMVWPDRLVRSGHCHSFIASCILTLTSEGRSPCTNFPNYNECCWTIIFFIFYFFITHTGTAPLNVCGYSTYRKVPK